MKKQSVLAAQSTARKEPPAARAKPIRFSDPTAASMDETNRDPAPSPRLGLAAIEASHVVGPVPIRPVRFGFFQPDARSVCLVGSFNGWNPNATPMERDSLGDWSVEIALPIGEHRYRFVVDGEWRDDPAAQQTEKNPFGGFDAVMVVV